MNANFHTHTARCHHATGTDREYVESAIAAGLTVLGFSDHSPYWFPNDYYSSYRMRPGKETDEYFSSLLALRNEYRKDIRIYIGFEAEYYPLYFDRFLEMIEPYHYDYLILGQHYIHNEVGRIATVRPNDSEDFLSDYVNECIEGLQTGHFFYLAHPDMAAFTGDPTFYDAQMRYLCTYAKAVGIPLELNLLGIRDHRTYPNPSFWKIAAQVGNEVILGCDAHSPDVIARQEDLAAAKVFLDTYGLHAIEPKEPIYR